MRARVVIALIVLSTATARADERSVGVDLVFTMGNIIGGGVAARYEQPLAPHHRLVGSVGFSTASVFESEVDTPKYAIYASRVGYRAQLEHVYGGLDFGVERIHVVFPPDQGLPPPRYIHKPVLAFVLGWKLKRADLGIDYQPIAFGATRVAVHIGVDFARF